MAAPSHLLKQKEREKQGRRDTREGKTKEREKKEEKKRVPKSYLTQRQAIPWPCPAHGSSQKDSPKDGGEKKVEDREKEEEEEEEKDKEEEKVLNNCSCL